MFSKHPLSFTALIIGLVVAVTIRFSYYTNHATNGYNATTWDAFGYYAYLPGSFIYKDVKKLDWYPTIEKKYHVSGGVLYQADTLKNGNLVFKYLGGVAILEAPFFAVGHIIANVSEAPEDGFSWPYQYAIMWGAVFWFLVGLIVLMKILLRYYSDKITAMTLLLIVLATNLLQYVSVDGAMSHCFLFPLYAFVLYWTIRWHESPKRSYALAIGLTIGLAIISRPTELVMIFIPILWSMDASAKLRAKWALVRNHLSHVYLALIGGFIGILPQLIYWKLVTGSWIYDVGSKWFFLNPWWRVIFGFEKGWFVYTPIAIGMVIGLFLMKGKSFRKAILTVGLLNLWIIISWSDWRYGASYSTRALIQSYPVYAFALAALLERIDFGKVRYVIPIVGTYLCFLNLFQLWQYNRTILHFDDMNYSYYKAIYWNTNPSPLDYSLLDSAMVAPDNTIPVQHADYAIRKIKFGYLEASHCKIEHKAKWIHSKMKLKTINGLNSGSYLLEFYQKNKLIHQHAFRLGVPMASDRKWMRYESYLAVPNNADSVAMIVKSFSELNVQFLATKLILEKPVH
jgi:hypothetical protein